MRVLINGFEKANDCLAVTMDVMSMLVNKNCNFIYEHTERTIATDLDAKDIDMVKFDYKVDVEPLEYTEEEFSHKLDEVLDKLEPYCKSKEDDYDNWLYLKNSCCVVIVHDVGCDEPHVTDRVGVDLEYRDLLIYDEDNNEWSIDALDDASRKMVLEEILSTLKAEEEKVCQTMN